MAEWFRSHVEVVFFIYGLAFTIMGSTVWVQPKRESGYYLGKIMWLFVCYALIHAPADFLDMWFAANGRNELAYEIAQSLTFVSYLFLFEFGRRLIGSTGVRIPSWLLPLDGGVILIASAYSDNPWTTANALMGYFVRFPAGMLAGLGFLRYYRSEMKSPESLRSRRYFLAASAATLAWAFFCGGVRAKAAFFPASWLNTESFLEIVGVPVYLFRTLCAVVMAWALIGILRIFDVETLSRLKGYKVSLESIGDGVVAVDSEDRIVLVNAAAESMTGWTQADTAGRPVGDVLRREAEFLIGRDGSRRPIEAGTYPILDQKSGRSMGAVVVFRDVTEKAQAQAEMLRAQKLESLGILAAGIAHEIRNPLSGINIGISSIEHLCGQASELDPDMEEEFRSVTGQMNSAAMKIETVVRRIIEFSKPMRPVLGMANLNEVIEEAIRVSASTLRVRKIDVLKDLAPDLPLCCADIRLIEQVLVNLITNACQAMEGTEGAKRLEIASAGADGMVVIRVSDSGPGVPPSIRGRIFDPFFTTRKDGSGIGLSFSHRIVADHGGRLGVDTSKWGGAMFRIELPTTVSRPDVL